MIKNRVTGAEVTNGNYSRGPESICWVHERYKYAYRFLTCSNPILSHALVSDPTETVHLPLITHLYHQRPAPMLVASRIKMPGQRNNT